MQHKQVSTQRSCAKSQGVHFASSTAHVTYKRLIKPTPKPLGVRSATKDDPAQDLALELVAPGARQLETQHTHIHTQTHDTHPQTQTLTQTETETKSHMQAQT